MATFPGGIGNLFNIPSQALIASQIQTQVSDANQAALITQQTRLDGVKTNVQMAQLNRSMQTSMYKSIQTSAVDQAKAADSVAKAVNGMLKGASL